MGSISEEFKDQKVNDLLEDYIALEKKIEEVSQRVVALLEETEGKFDKSIANGILKLQAEIDVSLKAWNGIIHDADERSLLRIKSVSDLISNMENEGGDYAKKLSSIIAEEKRGIIEEGGRTKESFRQEASQVLSEMKDELKKQSEHYKPLKKSTIFGFAFGVALAISTAFSAGMYLYLSSKADIEIGKANAELKTVLGSAQKLLDLTEKTISALPAKQQSAAKKELQQIIK